MTDEELAALRARYPNALEIWHDHMFELSKMQLIETILFHISTTALTTVLGAISQDITESRLEELENGSR